MTEKSEGPSKTREPRIGRALAARLKAGMVVLVVVAAIGFGAAYFYSASELNRLRDTSSQTADKEAVELIKEIGQHMVLPDEKPTIATVEDKQKLKEQSFFKNSQNGDKVLMYTQHKKAILYRPAEDKVIEVAYLNVKDKQ